MSTLLAYDAGSPGDIPPGEPVRFGYLDGDTAWPRIALAFADLSITVFDSLQGEICDAENGNPTTPAKFCMWAKGRLTVGDFAPRLYGTAGYTEPHRALADQMQIPFRWWAADWTGVPHLPPQSDACQFASPTVPGEYVKGNYDVTLYTPYFLATSSGGKTVTTLNAPVVGGDVCATGGYWEVGADGGVFTFGGAPELGTMAGKILDRPIVGMTGTKTGRGYFLWGADGGVYAFGDAIYAGSVPGDGIGPAA